MRIFLSTILVSGFCNSVLASDRGPVDYPSGSMDVPPCCMWVFLPLFALVIFSAVKQLYEEARETDSPTIKTLQSIIEWFHSALLRRLGHDDDYVRREPSKEIKKGRVSVEEEFQLSIRKLKKHGMIVRKRVFSKSGRFAGFSVFLNGDLKKLVKTKFDLIDYAKNNVGRQGL